MTRVILIGWLLCGLSSISILLYESSKESRLHRRVGHLYNESQKKPVFRLFVNSKEAHEADTSDIPIHNGLAQIELALLNIGSRSALGLQVHLRTPHDIGKLTLPERWREQRSSLLVEEAYTKDFSRRHFVLLPTAPVHPGTLLHLGDFELQHSTQETTNIPLMVRTSVSGGHRQQWQFNIRLLS